ncbi:MAG: hypothetical protein ACK5P7_00240 [Bdellovibrio sp.]
MKNIESQFFHQIGFVSKRQILSKVLSDVKSLFEQELATHESLQHLNLIPGQVVATLTH